MLLGSQVEYFGGEDTICPFHAKIWFGFKFREIQSSKYSSGLAENIGALEGPYGLSCQPSKAQNNSPQKEI